MIAHSHEVPTHLLMDIKSYQKFVAGRANVLLHQPELTFSMAYATPTDSAVARQAYDRYFRVEIE